MGEDSEKNRYMYNWIALLYTWNEHNTVNQLYSSVKLKKKKNQWSKYKNYNYNLLENMGINVYDWIWQ